VRIRSYGIEALLVELESAGAATALLARLAESPLPGTVETMPGLQTVLLRFDPEAVEGPTLARRVADLEVTPLPVADDDGAEPTVVRVDYDGPDLDDVATHSGLSVDEIVTAHAACTYRVALIGMAPGFYFLAGGDPRLQPPRRPAPRERVPRGAVGLAGPFTGIYPKDGPGGWQLIGRVRDELWHPDRLPAALLEPGATVRLTAA
jgi:KipI family sensor histidine kinase inhibitor